MLFMTPINAFAEIIPYKIYAIAHNDISNDELCANSVLAFQTLDQYYISDIDYIEKDSIITLKIKEKIDAKRGKRNGYLKVELISYTIPSKNDEEVMLTDKELSGTLKLSTKKDLEGIAKNAGVSLAGHVLKIPGFSQAVAVSKGLIKPNPSQNRLQSAGTNLYESTPLTYAEKGKEIKIEQDSIVVIKLKDQCE